MNNWRSIAASTCDPPARVDWFEDTPVCGREACPQYDGKRCRAMGFRPDRICEPVVSEMARMLDRAREAAGLP